MSAGTAYENGELGPGTGYYRRDLKNPWARKLESGKPIWEYQKWGALAPADRAAAIKHINSFNAQAQKIVKIGGPTHYQYAMLRCSTCRCYHNTVADWVGDECQSCKVSAKGKFAPKVGDIWKLPKTNSPMWTDQWGYQGSAKAPYIISKKMDAANGSTTKDGWACSCMAFTRNTPRTPCKHILNVMLKYGRGSVHKVAAKMANVDDAKLKEFEEWQRQQAALKAGNVPTAGAKLNLFGVTTRKFR